MHLNLHPGLSMHAKKLCVLGEISRLILQSPACLDPPMSPADSPQGAIAAEHCKHFNCVAATSTNKCNLQMKQPTCCIGGCFLTLSPKNLFHSNGFGNASEYGAHLPLQLHWSSE